MYTDILDFSKQLISNCISVNVQCLHQNTFQQLSFSERSDFVSMLDYHLSQCLEQYFQQAQTSTISKLMTPFHTMYYILCISKENDEHLMIGPFLEEPIEENVIYLIINNLRLTLDYAAKLNVYYQSIPYIEPTTLLEILNTIHNYIRKDINPPKIHTLDLRILSKTDSSYDLLLQDMNRTALYKNIEKRYLDEEKLLSYITNGDFHLAQLHWNDLLKPFKELSSLQDSIRTRKHLLISANTLFRKASQEGGVHPVYLNELWGKWALKIEQANSFEALDKLPLQMLRAYCLMTKNRSLAQYSPTVKRALTFIHLNLSTNLTVKGIASEIGLSPDYLTRLFKKELNLSVIHYINKKRIYKSLKLLATTELSIQEIGDLVGVGNTSYFHTLFKKEIGLSPKQYRAQLKGS